jgi:hypothetical protein
MLYKNVKFSPHPLKTIKPSPPHPKKKPIWKIKIPRVPCHLISFEPNFERTPCTPTQEAILWKERKEKKITLYLVEVGLRA